MTPTIETRTDQPGSVQRTVSLLERSKCYCHELRNTYNQRHRGKAGDDTSDILQHINALDAELVRLKQANDPSSATASHE